MIKIIQVKSFSTCQNENTRAASLFFQNIGKLDFEFSFSSVFVISFLFIPACNYTLAFIHKFIQVKDDHILSMKSNTGNLKSPKKKK